LFLNASQTRDSTAAQSGARNAATPRGAKEFFVEDRRISPQNRQDRWSPDLEEFLIRVIGFECGYRSIIVDETEKMIVIHCL